MNFVARAWRLCKAMGFAHGSGRSGAKAPQGREAGKALEIGEYPGSQQKAHELSGLTTRLLVAALLSALVTWPSTVKSADEETTETLLPRRCGVCHLDRVPAAKSSGSFNYLALRRVDAADSSGSSGMCYSCHSGPVHDSRRSIWRGRQHPSKGGEDEGRSVNCGTCHDPHVKSEGSRPFMRFPRGAISHCMKCHPGRRGNSSREHPVSSGTSAGKGGPPHCNTCHTVHGAAGKGLTRTRDAAALCGKCHGANPSRKGRGFGNDSHPAGAEGPDCLGCHQAHRASSKTGLLARGVNDGSLCMRCHQEHSSSTGGEGNHVVLPGKVQCLSCHRAHNSVSEGWAKLLNVGPRKAGELCRSCHDSHYNGKGPLNHPVGQVIPETDRKRLDKLAGYGGRLGPDSTVICLTCHRAHGAWKGTAAMVVGPQAICLYCHVEQNSLSPATARFGTHPVSVKPKKATIDKLFLSSGGETGKNGEIICLTCHRSHGSQSGTPGLVLAMSDYKCTLCHLGQGSMKGTKHDISPESSEDAHPRESCGSCHGDHGWSRDVDAVSMGGTAVDKLCWSCHSPESIAPFTGFFGHTTGVTPKKVTRDDLPLFWNDGRRLDNGIITCATCHNAHGNEAEHFLRLNPGETRSELCSGCHGKQDSVTGTKHDMSMYFPLEKNRLGESAEKTGTCGACHLVHSDAPGGTWARDVGEASGGKREEAAFCNDCHRQGSFAQGKIVSEELHPSTPPPLFGEEEKKSVSCRGCHDPHRWNPVDSSDKGDFFTDGGSATSFLVRPAEGREALCIACHNEQTAVVGTPHDLTSMGEDSKRKGNLCGRCHRVHGGDPAFLWNSPMLDKGPLGATPCASCHSPGEDGTSSPHAGPNSHPLGVYPGRERGEGLPLYDSAGKVRSDGMVSCGTCHNPHILTPSEAYGAVGPGEKVPSGSFLRLSADGYSPLCFPCHFDKSMVVGTDHDLRVTAPEKVNLDGLNAGESGVCGTCHKVHGSPESSFLWNRPLGEGVDLPTRLCRGCHNSENENISIPERLEAHLVSYPGKGMVSRIFSIRQRSLLDLSQPIELYSMNGKKEGRGYLSCASCHDVHRWQADASRSGEGVPLDGDLKNSFLRLKNTFAISRSFCKECHGEDSLQYFQQYHKPEVDKEEQPPGKE